LTWDEIETKGVARARLEAGVEFLRAAGCCVVDGCVGDEDHVLAIEDELRRRRYAGIVVSTLPLGVSRGLKLDVASRIKRRVPADRLVVHVVGTTPNVEPTADNAIRVT